VPVSNGILHELPAFSPKSGDGRKPERRSGTVGGIGSDQSITPGSLLPASGGGRWGRLRRRRRGSGRRR
jgi:hypothetical protein